MSIAKWSFLGIILAIGGLSAGWGQPYGAVVALGVVIVFIGDELIKAVQSLRDGTEIVVNVVKEKVSE